VTVSLGLPADVRGVLRSFAQQLVALLDGEAAIEEEALRRLFPPAYAGSSPEDVEYEGEYRRLMGDDLRVRHRESAQVLLDTVDAESLTDEQAEEWLKALNELRLVLGTMLDVSEDEDPDDPLYDLLTYVQGELVEHLSTAL
jgi:hypothetical protein